MYANRPIIGITGGIGSGKSYVAQLFGELGCLVIEADAQVREAYRMPAVKQTLATWWGDAVFDAGGEVDRRAVAKRVFADPAERQRLENLVHPIVERLRDQAMAAAVQDPARAPHTVAFVWDTPLLFEKGIAGDCDALVFVDAPLELRQARVRRQRGWDAAELARRENLQWALDKKREISDYRVTNTADAGAELAKNTEDVREQVRQILSRIVTRSSQRPGLE